MEFQTAQLYLEAAFRQGDLLNQVWSQYENVILAILAGLVFSNVTRRKLSLGRTLAVLTGLTVFFVISVFGIAAQGQRLDALLSTTRQAFTTAHIMMPVEARRTFLDPLLAPAMNQNIFQYHWEYTIAAHIVIDLVVLVAAFFILRSDDTPSARF